ncbi:TetR/AcrR family transcriptional regulator [Alphaproteobacteria bacterium]|nr:TetR/AcrR family transcriptional regulator [Alphaproteobacteria bacterium]
MPRKQYHHGNLKEEIIIEALEQLNLVGADNLSFRTIAKNVGVVSSAPYNHFKSKKQLFKNLISIGTKLLLKKMKEESLKKKIPADRLANSAKAYLKFSLEEKELFLLMFSKNNLEIGKLVDAISSQFLDIVKEKFKDGSRMRVTEKGASITAWAMVHGLANLSSNNNLEVIEKNVELQFEEIFNQMAAIWGKGVAN